MKKLLVLTIVAVLMLSTSVMGFSETLCEGDYSYWCGITEDGEHKDWQATWRFGNNLEEPGDWELGLWDKTYGNYVADQGGHVWTEDWEDFTLSYDPTNGEVVMTIYEAAAPEIVSFTYDADKAYEYLALIANGKNDGSNVMLRNLEFNGESLTYDEWSTGNNRAGLRIELDDCEQESGFLLEGQIKMIVGNSPQDERPSFHVVAMNTHDPICDPDIPEFGIIGAVAVLGLAGLFIARRRN